MTESNNSHDTFLFDKKNKEFYSSSQKSKNWSKISYLKKNTIINERYKIIKQIGHGGFGIVYESKDMLLKTRVALKFINPDYLSDEKKFLRVRREINISRKITDKRIVKIFSLEQTKGIYFLVMELLEGKTLKELIKEKRKLSWKEFSPIFKEIIRAIKTLHDNNIIHRDLKPSNIFITNNGEVKLLDFGLSKETNDTEKTSTAGEIIGTPQYIAPELVKGEEIDNRSDIYQLALTSCNILTGELPFSDKTNSTFEIIVKRIKEKPDIHQLSKIKIPKYLKFILNKSLEPDKNKRFNNINEIIKIIKQKKVGFSKIIFYFFSKHIKLFSTLIILTILLFSLTFIYIKNNKKFSYINYKESTLTAYNMFGIKLWKKDFRPFKIFHAEKIKLPPSIFDIAQKEINFNYTKKGVYLLLNHNNYSVFPVNKSIQSNEKTSKMIFLDSNGKTIRTTPINYHLQSSEFINNFIYNKKNKIKTKINDYFVVNSKQTQGMYPTIIFIYPNFTNFFRIFSPGYIENFFIKDFNTNDYVFAIFKNNALCHTTVFLKKKINNNKQTGDINIIPFNSFINLHKIFAFYYFLPNFSVLKTIINENEFEIYDSFKAINMKLKIDNKYAELEIAGKDIKYKDKIENLFNSYVLINKIYRDSFYNNYYKKGYEKLKKLLKIKINTPYLNSIIYHVKGNIELKLKKYDVAYKSFKKSLEYDNYNVDTAQKLCEIEFIRGCYKKCLNLSENKYKDIINFWGLLEFGNRLFRFYLYTQIGNLEETKILINEEDIHASPTTKTILSSIYYLIIGKYKMSFVFIKKLFNKNQTPLTVIEYRLLLSRIIILNKIFKNEIKNEIFKLIKFYLNDIFLNSKFKRHFAGISYAYTLALQNKLEDSRYILKKSFELIKEFTKIDFKTKYWSFYDYFIYAKTMELLKNKKQAIIGYKLSIKANPHTHLAIYSRIRISELTKNNLK